MPQPVIDTHIALSDGWELGLYFLLEQMLRHFNATKDVLYGVSEVDGHKYTDDGIYLPDIGAWKWHSGPSPEEIRASVQNPTGFIGPVADTERTSNYTQLASAKNGYAANLPYGVSLAFDDASNTPVKCPVEVEVLGEANARELEKLEILTLRALRYLGALKHTLSERCAHAPVCLSIQITSDYSLAGALRIVDVEGQNRTTRHVALIFVELDVRQDQYIPKAIPPGAP